MRALQRAEDEVSKVQRIWAAALVGAAIGIPVLLDERMVLFPRRWTLSEGSLAGLPGSSTAVRAAAFHLSWMMCFCGIAPYLANSLGLWTDMQLGSWSLFTPLFVWGGALMVEFSQPRHIYIIGFALGTACMAVFLTSARSVIGMLIGLEVHHNMRMGVFPGHFIIWLGYALLNGYCACSTFYFLWCRASVRLVYDLIHFNLNITAGLCGALILFGYVLPIAALDLELALQYTHSLGTAATSVSWLALALLNSPRNRVWCLGPWAQSLSSLNTGPPVLKSLSPQL
jgi:hypothetical protein